METIRYKRQLQAGLLSGSASIRSQYQPIRPEVKPQNVVFSDQKRIVNTPESKYLVCLRLAGAVWDYEGVSAN
jgi:hypothetical protein